MSLHQSTPGHKCTKQAGGNGSLTYEETIEEYSIEKSLQVNFVRAVDLIRTSTAPTMLDTIDLQTVYNTIVNSELIPGLTPPSASPITSQIPLPSNGSAVNLSIVTTTSCLSSAVDRGSHGTNLHSLSFQDETPRDHDRRWFMIRLSRSFFGSLLVRATEKLAGMAKHCKGTVWCCKLCNLGRRTTAHRKKWDTEVLNHCCCCF
ncbi:uncharacterized protein BJ171DRAFT_508696 [Polychytrium aggregatum]|uniref:uncharacterized protein n=1 Tax=Polychytrium aggregatum TaxID=110093 RepID=UPI0022FE7DCD|nr:uncharacterized protein BJ171DRAFT_508696 [Polychytrium aggregatum]KAI9203909.1 hypothetical protein BJ171DRAFT_508696 [Polychytrium aggregatum]